MNNKMNTLQNLSDNTGILICGHGSRAKLAEEEFSLLAAGLRAKHPQLKVEYGFLEYSSPNIHMALDKLLAQGVTSIHAVPGMLFAATHAKNDIPSVLTTYQEKHPGLTIEYGEALGLHQEMIKAFQARILESMGMSSIPTHGELYETLLVVVGRGTSVVEANAEAAKLTRIVCENLGFGWSETVYSGVTYPSVGRGLEMAVKLGFKKIVVAPYFLFGGRLINRIHAYIDKVAQVQPDIQFYKANYLRDQTHVINTFIARIEETFQNHSGETASEKETHPKNLGLMADFKRRLALGEVDIHHHHAEFQPEIEIKDPEDDESSKLHNHTDSDTHSHSHSHSNNGHGHTHHHAPYRHIGHPHGPRTMINENLCCCFMGQFPQAIIDEEKSRRPEVPGTPSCKLKNK